MFPSSFIHACTVSCLAANLLTWHVNVQGVSSLQLCPFYTIRHQRLWRRRVGQHFAAVTQHCRRRVCSSPQWYINWLCSCNEITIRINRIVCRGTMKPSPLRSDAHTSCLVVPGCLCQYQWGGISPTQVDMKYCKSPSCKLKHRCVKYLTNEWVFNLGLRGMECHDKVPFFFFLFSLH